MPARRPPVPPPRGFTLIELVVVMVIAAIVIAFALPDMRRMLNENRMATEANSMLTLLAYARGEALRRNRPVAVCASTDGQACDSTPAASGFAAGAIVFESNSSGSTGTVSRSASSDPLLRATVPVANNTRILGDGNLAGGIVFNPGGDARQSGSLFVLPVTAVAANTCQRLIDLARTGRARVAPVRYSGGTANALASYTPTQDCGVAG